MGLVLGLVPAVPTDLLGELSQAGLAGLLAAALPRLLDKAGDLWRREAEEGHVLP